MAEIGKGILEAILEDCRKKDVTLEKWLCVALERSKDNPIIPKKEQEKEETLEQKVTHLLKLLCVPANLQGYHYIRYAIIYSLENGKKINRVTKEVYPEIAHEFKTTPARVERAIRHAIESSFERVSQEAKQEIFGYIENDKIYKPTSSEYISSLIDYIRINEM